MRYIFKNIVSTVAKTPLLAFLIVLCLVSSTFAILYSNGSFQNYEHQRTINNEFRLYDEYGSLITTLTIELRDENNERINGTVGELRQVMDMLSDETKEGFIGFFFYLDMGIEEKPTELEAIKEYILRNEITDYLNADGSVDLDNLCDTVDHYIQNGKPVNELFLTDVAIRIEYHKDTKEYGVYSEYAKNRTVLAGRGLSDNDYRKGQYIMTVDENYPGLLEVDSYSEAVGREFELFGKTYKIVGVTEDTFGYEVPFDTIPDSADYRSFSITINDGMITTPVYDELCDALRSVYGDKVVIPEIKTADVTDVNFYTTLMWVSVLIAVISAINIAILFRYILNTRKKELSIMRICGCTKGRARRMYVGEILLVSSAVYVICALIFSQLVLPYLVRFYENIMDVYNFKAYAIMYAVYIAAIYITVNIMTVIYLHSAPAAMLKERGR